MSVITFYGNNKVETAQTTSMAGIATYLAYQQNYKILLINAKYNDTSLQECFWDNNKNIKNRADLETGIGGVVKAIASNKTSPEIITNYTCTIFKGRLELLTDDNITDEKFKQQKEYMKSIIKLADKYYDLVFVDIEGSLEDLYIDEIIKESNLIVANTTQRIKMINEFIRNKKLCEGINENNVIYLLGKYDMYSKYNVKNLQRLLKNQEIYGIPYNTLMFEYSNEGKLDDFIIKFLKAKENSSNGFVMKALDEVSNRIVDKLKELQKQV